LRFKAPEKGEAMTQEEQSDYIRKLNEEAAEFRKATEANFSSITTSLKAISDNQQRFDNALSTLVEMNANHETQMRKMEERHNKTMLEMEANSNRHMAHLERIMDRLSYHIIDHDDRLSKLEDKNKKPPPEQGGEPAAA
jgi:hypothetical protein